MEEFKGTKGEWEVGEIDETRVWSKEHGLGGLVAWCTNEGHNSNFYLDKTHDVQKANARLIAAAPDMLKAFELIEHELKKVWPREEWEEFDEMVGFSKAIKKAIG